MRNVDNHLTFVLTQVVLVSPLNLLSDDKYPF